MSSFLLQPLITVLPWPTDNMKRAKSEVIGTSGDSSHSKGRYSI